MGMATPGELVREMAAAFGVSEATVAVHDRNLAVAGLRTKLGRGTSAAQMTPRDAAHLTVAIMGSAEVRDSVIAVQRYTAVRAERHITKVQNKKSSVPQIPELFALEDGHSFTEALEAIYAAVISGSFRRAFEKKVEGVPDHRHHNSLDQLQIDVHAPGARAGIGLQGFISDRVDWQYGLPTKPPSAHLALLGKLKLDQSWGMQQLRYIRGNVIFRVGLALIPNPGREENLKAKSIKASRLAECS